MGSVCVIPLEHYTVGGIYIVSPVIIYLALFCADIFY